MRPEGIGPRTAFSGLDPVQRQGPPDTHEARVKALLDFREEFNKASTAEEPPTHRGSNQGRRFETFLLAWLRPRTFDDFSKIDELLEEGPPA